MARSESRAGLSLLNQPLGASPRAFISAGAPDYFGSAPISPWRRLTVDPIDALPSYPKELPEWSLPLAKGALATNHLTGALSNSAANSLMTDAGGMRKAFRGGGQTFDTPKPETISLGQRPVAGRTRGLVAGPRAASNSAPVLDHFLQPARIGFGGGRYLQVNGGSRIGVHPLGRRNDPQERSGSGQIASTGHDAIISDAAPDNYWKPGVQLAIKINPRDLRPLEGGGSGPGFGGGPTTSGPSPLQRFFANMAQGRSFEKAALAALKLIKNQKLYRVKGLGASIPDSLTRGVTEIKSGLEIDYTIQMRIQANIAKMRRVPYNLIVNTTTQRVAKDLQDVIAESGGTIVRFDPATGTIRPFP